MSFAKTKKKKTFISNSEKKKLWSIFDMEPEESIEEKTENQENMDARNRDTSNSIECIYDVDISDTLPLQNISSDEIGQIIKIQCEPDSPLSLNRVADIKSTETETFQNKCHQCTFPLIIMEDGFPTCTNSQCGIMYTKTLDYSPEWRYYGSEDKNATDPTRCGNPINPLLQESSFGCKILCGQNASYEMKRIRKYTEWGAMPHREKSLYDEFQFITIMAQNSGIPKIFIDDAMALHKDISEQKMFRGMNRDGIKAASIYISCRQNGCPRTAHEIAEIFHLDKTSATNGCSMAVNIMSNIKRNTGSTTKGQDLCSTTPSSFIERYCSRLNINAELTTLSKFIAQKIERDASINNNTPHSIAAGIVYFIGQTCNLPISKTDVKQVCGVSEVTINKCYKKLDVLREKLVPSCIIDKYAI